MILTGATMLVVIGIWVISMRYNIPSITQQNDMTYNDLTAQKADFQEVFSVGLKTIGDIIKVKLSSGQKTEIALSERNFILDTLKPIPKTQLP